jgi:hypothetical protein
MTTTARRARHMAAFATPTREAETARSHLKRRVPADTFYSEGVVAQMDHWGVERFNFPQEIWLYPNIAMGSDGAAPSEVLAVNILTRLIQVRDVRVVIGATARRALQLAPAFVEECLSAREPHWTRYTIPISALRAWVALNR